MAAATGALALALAGVGLSVYQYSKATKKEQKAQKAADEATEALEATIQEGVENKMSALKIPTKGIKHEEAVMARAVGSGVEAAQQAGAAGVIGGVGRITQAAGEQSAQQAARIEQAEFGRDKLVAQQEQDIALLKYQGMTGLHGSQIAGAGQAAADAYAAQQAAILGAQESLTSASESMGGGGKKEEEEPE